MLGWHTDLMADGRDGVTQQQKGRDNDAGEKWGHGHNRTGPDEREQDCKMASEGQVADKTDLDKRENRRGKTERGRSDEFVNEHG